MRLSRRLFILIYIEIMEVIMNQYSVAKALLGLYTKLPDATLHIQNSVDKLVRRSFYYDRNTSTYNLCNKIIELNSLKADYVNIKVLVDKATAAMDKDARKLLHLRFVKKWKFVKIANYFNVTLRTVFRQYDRAVSGFCLQAERLGYDLNEGEELFGHLPLFLAQAAMQESSK